MTVEMVRLGVRELALRWRTTLGTTASVGVALLVFLALESITNGAAAALAPPEEPAWIVQQRGAMGEFTGSRLPGGYADRLRALGASTVLGEIHTATGASFADITLVRGVPLEAYTGAERFTMVAGAALAPGDAAAAMVGQALAEARGWDVGDSVSVRGRAFTIKGIFRAGTLADSEAWLPLQAAQEALGFGSDVSIYVVRGDDTLPARIEAALPVEVAREGEGLARFARSLRAIVRILRIVSGVMAAAAALSLLTVTSTIVRARRRELAVLRSVGFGPGACAAYVLAQVAAVAVCGYGVALLATLGLLRVLDFTASGVTVAPRLDGRVAGLALLWSLAIGLVAGAYPTVLAARLNPAEALRAE